MIRVILYTHNLIEPHGEIIIEANENGFCFKNQNVDRKESRSLMICYTYFRLRRIVEYQSFPSPKGTSFSYY